MEEVDEIYRKEKKRFKNFKKVEVDMAPAEVDKLSRVAFRKRFDVGRDHLEKEYTVILELDGLAWSEDELRRALKEFEEALKCLSDNFKEMSRMSAKETPIEKPKSWLATRRRPLES